MRLTPLFAVLFALLFAAPASAAVPHVVQPGETLWSIAAANNLTTRTVAAFNGLSENSQVVLGSTIMVPTPSRATPPCRRRGSSRRRRRRRRLRAGAPPRRPVRGPRPARRLHRAAGRHVVRPRRRRARVAQRDRGHERPRSQRRPARRHGDQAAHRRARARPCLPARPGRDRRAAGRSRTHRDPPRRGRRAVGRRAARRLAVAGDRDRVAGERLQQRHGLLGQRPRGHAGDAGHVGLRAAEPGRRASSTRTRPTTT